MTATVNGHNRVASHFAGTKQQEATPTADKGPKPPPKMLRDIRAAINDDVLRRLGPDAFAVLVVIRDQQDNKHDRPVGFYRDQLARRCGFNPKTPRRLQNAVKALEADGWLEVKRPANGERAESVYRILPKPISDPRTERTTAPSTDQDTGVRNAPGDDVTRRISDLPPGAFLTDDPAHECATPSSSISTSKETTSKKNTPLTPQGGEVGGNDSFDDSQLKGGKRTRRKTSTMDEIRTVPIPASLNQPAFLQAWQEWLDHLSEKRKLPTKSAAGKQLQKCVGLGVQTAISWLDNAIEKNWNGLWPPPEAKKGSDLFSGQREALARWSDTQKQRVPSFEELQARGWNPQTGLGPPVEGFGDD